MGRTKGLLMLLPEFIFVALSLSPCPTAPGKKMNPHNAKTVVSTPFFYSFSPSRGDLIFPFTPYKSRLFPTFFYIVDYYVSS